MTQPDTRKTLQQLFMAGTGFSQQNDFIESLPYTPVIDGQSELARKALMGVAAQRLQQQAGFIPGTDPRPLPEKCPPDNTHPCSQAAMSYLFIMLNGHYRGVLTEWLREIVRTEQHVQAEAVIHLLSLGDLHNDLRPLIKSALGERGLWLAAQRSSSRQRWIIQTKTVHVDLTVSRRKEAKYMRQLQKKKDKRPVFQRLTQHRTLWSDDLADYFLVALAEDLQRHRPDNPLREMLLKMRFYYPPAIADRLYDVMLSRPTDYRDWGKTIETIDRLLTFRLRMLDAIYEPYKIMG